jgi:hypothetical protein
MNHSTRLNSAIALALLLALAPVGLAGAADNEGSGQSGSAGSQSGAAASNEPVTEADLEKFAAAYGQLQTVRAEYGQKLRQAEEQSKQQALRKEGQQAMVQAIRDEGLEIAEYRRIGKRLSNDQELRSKLQQMMQERSGNSG